MRTAASCVVTLLLTVGAVTACSSDPAPAESAIDTVAAELIEEFDVHVGDITQIDVFAPRDGSSLPVAVLLHGTVGNRAGMYGLARKLAEDGAVVFVARWPVLDNPAREDRDDEELYRAQIEAVVCALRRTKVLAPQYGGDPVDLTLVGFSGGGMVGATAALVDEPPWHGVDCDAGVDHAPKNFVGLAGDYRNHYQFSGFMGSTFDPFDPFLVDPTNSALSVRLYHGLADGTVEARDSSDFEDHLMEAGIDVHLTMIDTGHAELVRPESDAGAFVLAEILRVLRGEPSPTPGSVDGAMQFDGRCTFDAAVASGDTVLIDLANLTDEPVWFGVFSTLDVGDLSDVEPGVPFDSLPGGRPWWHEHVTVREVPAASTRSWTWAMVEGARTFLPLCIPRNQAGEGAGVAYSAARPDGSLAVVGPAD